MIKRQRGRGRNPGQKPQNNNPNRAYESNGPDLKVRGSAQTVFEKYQQLGRDCQSNGDRVLGENYMQHAEHYFRVLRAMQPTFVPRTELMIAGYDDEEYESEDNSAGSNGEGETAEGANGSAQPEFQQNRPQRDNHRDNNRDNNRDRDNNRAPREFRDNREPREPRDQNEPRNFEPRNNEPRHNDGRNGEMRGGEGEEGRYGRRRRRPDRPDRPERFSNDGAPQAQGEGDQAQRGEGRPDNRPDNRYEGRREPRPDYNGDSEQPMVPVETPVSFNQPEFEQPSSFSDPQEISVAADVPPVRERRPRPPRAPREAREATPRAARAPRAAAPSEPETGFGDEMPAFLAAPVPVISAD